VKATRTRDRLWILLTALLVTALLLPSLLYPFGRDQAVFAYVGSVMARGGLPYRDAWDLKPPGIYLAYAFLATLSPNHGAGLMYLLRGVDVAIVAGVGILLAAIARRCGHPEAAIPAAGWYACLYLQGGYWGLAQAEGWANLWVLGAIWLCLAGQDRRGRRQLFVAGVLGGVGAVLKFTTVLPLLPFLVQALRKQPEQERLRGAAAAVTGLAVSLAGATLWLAVTGILPAYLEIQRGFVAPYTQLSASTPLQHLEHVVRYTAQWLASIWLPGALAIYAGVDRGRERAAPRALFAMLGGGLVAVWIQDKYFGYHWQTVLPAVALLAALGSVRLGRCLRLSTRHSGLAAVLLIVFWAGGTRGTYYRDAARVALGSLSYPEWLQRFGRPGVGDNSFLADTWAADYVRQHTQPDDGVLVWGFEPAVYLLADRRPPTRFFFNVPVTSSFVPATWRQEFLHAVQSHPPELLLTVRNDAVPWASGLTDDSETQLQAWTELRQWRDQNYQLERQIEDFSVYRKIHRDRGQR
jgi:hypothetical protein